MIFSDLVHIVHFFIFEPPQKGRNEVLEKSKTICPDRISWRFRKKNACAPVYFFFDQIPLLKKMTLKVKFEKGWINYQISSNRFFHHPANRPKIRGCTKSELFKVQLCLRKSAKWKKMIVEFRLLVLSISKLVV